MGTGNDGATSDRCVLAGKDGSKTYRADAGAGNGVVLIDSGHGGSDPGKIGIHQEKEKDINLQIAKRLKKQLEKNGVKSI